ncbi:MAG: GFA family protein [Pseudomonadota bacterium]
MTDWKLPWSASCLCTKIQMLVTEPPLLSLACHCKPCQKLSSSAYSMALIVPSSGFAVTEGVPVLGGLHGQHKQYYCGHCKGWLFTRPAQTDTIVNVRATILDNAAWFVPFIDIETIDKLPGVSTGAEMSFEGTPPMEEFPAIATAFAERGVRPS